jgi:large subunit ribosomal protein L13
MKSYTKATRIKEITRSWHHVDVKGKILGTVAVDCAKLLMGKSKPYFVRSLDCGDYVVVTNASLVELSGSKKEEKLYARYSGYPGGLKKIPFLTMIKNRPEEVIRHAVAGMLPKNKLQDQLLKRLYVFKDEKHPYTSKLSNIK